MVSITPNLASFREEVAEFCRTKFPADLRAMLDKGQKFQRQHYVRWQKILQTRKWYAGHWPVEYGGCGWSALQRFVFDDEMLKAGCPYLPPFNHYYVGPILYTFGNEEQKAKYLAPTRDSDILWCQGYSEPSAGSDLAGLRTRAVRDGDHYVVNGQKMWTSNAHIADKVLALVRTSTEDRRTDGISFLMIDTALPGVDIKPITTMDMTNHCNEVFFNDVRVPATELIGEEGKAWTYSRYLLSNERLIGALVGKYRYIYSDLVSFARTTFEGGRPIIEDAFFRRELSEITVLMQTLDAVCHRLLSGVQQGGDLGAAGSILKLRGSEIEQRLGQAMMDVVARRGLPFQLEGRDPEWQGERVGPEKLLGWVTEYLMRRAATIYGGSSEVMHNIIGKAALGLAGV
ncbi:acyl-CoA dehydrogenase family protein [Rhizorhabdus dicambivorans]|uniref:acyl-CoA dehydrogenase family protein n=1 Tax=Rhizorhabdus dicambivorans TaxID=1850238 RepID=UPI0015968F4A|nr:acyl-CoA dehydrogenase family protein [Rhizorhabdus dicambivorans]